MQGPWRKLQSIVFLKTVFLWRNYSYCNIYISDYSLVQYLFVICQRRDPSSRRRNPEEASSSQVCIEKFLQLKYIVEIHSQYTRKKSRFAWSGAARNHWVMVTFLLFTSASKRCMVRIDVKVKIPEGNAKVDFVTLIVHSYLGTLVRYVLSVTLCGAAVSKLWTKRHWIVCYHL